MSRSNIISEALRDGLIIDDPSGGQGWSTVGPRVERMLARLNHNVTLFIGAAASSFTPTAFPTWDKFVELVYSSTIEEAATGVAESSDEVRASLNRSIAQALSWDNPQRVANYKFTETVARRLGTDYLRLLKAFEAQRGNGEWIVNHVHVWAAKCLIDGSAAVLVTTNFDNCIEKAIENAEANCYSLTGDPHVDGAEIFRRTRNGRLILIVSGPKQCEFVENVLPQVGKSISLVYKLHGSCYAPETCIDTRLQRQQGLPAYAVDILDYLLVRSVFFVMCFSGGDLNDNTDYLRMVHNRKNAQIVWLQQPNGQIEPGVTALATRLRNENGPDKGLCFWHGSVQGEQIRWDDEPSTFKRAVHDWCSGLGPSWCKLVILDVIELCNSTAAQRAALEALGFTDGQQAGWNRVVEQELERPEGSQQFAVASECSQIRTMLDKYLANTHEERDTDSILAALNTRSRTLRAWHIRAANNLSSHQPHAQAWVISALYGILLYCGDQQSAAGEALSFAQNAAFLVGDMESSNNIRNLLWALGIDPRSSSTTQEILSSAGEPAQEAGIIAFLPSLDGASAAANFYGVPRAMYVRALLHRAMLFADRIAVNPNVLVNSTVFVQEILFGNSDDLDRFYADFLYPVIVHDDPAVDRALLAMQTASNSRADYISEHLSQDLVTKLDDYFIGAGTQKRFLPYPIADAAYMYRTWIKRAATEMSAATSNHLMSRWRSLQDRTVPASPDIVRLDEELARDMIATILKALAIFTSNLSGPISRSKLYYLAGLHATLVGDDVAIDQQIRSDTDPKLLQELRDCRAKILERPWISGPFCHELFDRAYVCNSLFQITTKSAEVASLVFLEEREQASLQFMAALASETNPISARTDTVSIGSDDKISALLLGQASAQDIREYRRAFAPIRQMLATNTPLDPETKGRFIEHLRQFKRATADVESEDIVELSPLSTDTRRLLREFLKSCNFFVRKGEALARMYEEPVFTLPGALRLERL